eukprot:TRINITY_DN60940_c0_g1_i1.p1 TRINITY_DN60940_c0_g1~~TRINITY_DN60940_c0_g1_i1.p1  ORF type:complete len:204 (-),score=53.85 TRINITY_DN60940_c0_g1_i1:84-695(-)
MVKPKREGKEKKQQESKGVLAGKVKQLLPQALDLTRLVSKPGSAESDDDGPPQEIATQLGPTTVQPTEEQEDITSLPSSNKKSTKDTTKKGSLKTKKKSAKFIWQEPETQQLLEDLRVQDEQRRQKHLSAGRTEKAGIVLVQEGTREALGDAKASEFLKEELFDRRKRKRSMADRLDRNVLAGCNRATGLHRVSAKPRAKRKR